MSAADTASGTTILIVPREKEGAVLHSLHGFLGGNQSVPEKWHLADRALGLEAAVRVEHKVDVRKVALGDKASELDIAYLGLDEEIGKTSMQVETVPSPFDPLGTVAAFYGLLAHANGEAAAALVIPEKRGIGPFNEKSIHWFFGSLREPLKLMSVALQSQHSVMAGYRYTKPSGEVCDGKALVDTVYRYGKTLISKIRALNNC